MGLLCYACRHGHGSTGHRHRALSATVAASSGNCKLKKCSVLTPPLRARGSFQRLVGNRAGEDIFVSLVEVGGGVVVHGIALPRFGTATVN